MNLSTLFDDSFHLALSIVFVVLNAFFVAAEFALVKVRATRLELMVRKGDPLAKLVLSMVSNLNQYVSATQLGITLASLGLGWIGEPAFARMFEQLIAPFGFQMTPEHLHSLSFTCAFLVISGLHIVIGELVPKSVAIQMPEKVCYLIVAPLRIFYIVVFPFMWVLNEMAALTLRIFRFKPETHGGSKAHSEDEIKLIVEDSFEEGSISHSKRFLLDKAIEFSHKSVKEIMVQEKDMFCFYMTDSLENNLSRAKESGHTRFPLREKRDGRVLGFVHMKDVIWGMENNDVINLYDLMRPALAMTSKTTVDQALKEFQRKRVHLAIVESPEKEVLGMLTLEDVIEELVGEIEDEFDTEQ